MRKITGLFQWEQHQLPHIDFNYFTKENLCIQTEFFYSPNPQNKFLKYQVTFYWLEENFLPISNVIWFIHSGKAFCQERNKWRPCPTVPHLVSRGKSSPCQKRKFSATPPTSKAICLNRTCLNTTPSPAARKQLCCQKLPVDADMQAMCWSVGEQLPWRAEHESSWKYNKQNGFKTTLIKRNKNYMLQ